jgi:hypothetical protein
MAVTIPPEVYPSALADAAAPPALLDASLPTEPPRPGVPYALQADGDVISFCLDGAGLRLDPATGKRTPLARPCPADPEPIAACNVLGDEFEIRRPGMGPSDMVDIPGGPGVEVPSHVTDCATDKVAIVLASERKIILVAGGKTTTIARSRADRVALGTRWIVWSDGKTVRAVPRP